jgi:hypothetical protein
MAVSKVVDIVKRAQTILQDTTAVRWPLSELQYWLNDSYKEIVILRPDANAESATVTLAAGARQKCHDAASINLPNLLRVLDIVRNLHTSSDKRAIRRTDRKILDDQRPTWYTDTPSYSIQHYIYDDRNPHEFMVYPPASNGATVEIVYSSVPTAHELSEQALSNSAETIRVDDIYANAILDYILYRAYSKDAEYAANGQRAQAHYAAFSGALGAKTTADSTVSPNATSPSTPRG